MDNEIMDNQVQEELDYILPDDYEEEAEETTEADTEELEVAEDGEAETFEEKVEAKESAETLDELEVKFLHEVKKLKDIPRDELQTLVQKGMNHDRVTEKLSLMSEKYEKIKDLSNLYKMDENQLLDALYNQYYATTADNEGITPEQVKARTESNKKDTESKMYARFADKYPDVKAADIPKEVWDEVKSGEDLSRAYSDHIKHQTIQAKDGEVKKLNDKILALEQKLKTKEQNETVKKKAVVKSTSANGTDDLEDDDFLQGLLGK